MSRVQRSTNTDNIVIVCEGKDTEPNYLKELRDYLGLPEDRMRIVPFGDEAKKAELRDKALKKPDTQKSGRKKRTLNPPATPEKSGKYYWVMEEEDLETYNNCCGQPTRYVREAQLWVKYEGYTEGWAVYDLDTFTKHEEAITQAKTEPVVNIAFSAVSFEEWILLHFERNPKAFERSSCKDAKGQYLNCGTGKNPDDCQGDRCVAGRIQKEGFIKEYSKGDRKLFSEQTLPNIEIARINAAWSRSIHDQAKQPYECNPYTDFDKLIVRCFEISERPNLDGEYAWIGKGNTIDSKREKLTISRNQTAKEISLQNAGASLLIGQALTLTDKGQKFGEVTDLRLKPGESKSVSMQGAHLLRVTLDRTHYIVT